MSDKIEVHIMKLANGEEVIGKADFTDEGVVVVTDALQIMLMPSEEGRMSMGLMPYMPYAKAFLIYNSNLVAVGVPNDDLLEKYNRSFSKIVLPSTSIVS